MESQLNCLDRREIKNTDSPIPNKSVPKIPDTLFMMCGFIKLTFKVFVE